MNNVFPLPSVPPPSELAAVAAQTTKDNVLGAYLRDRRERLDPAALGLPMTRRRTPGLRREEVAQRAHVSPTWYTWLEQGRGGARPNSAHRKPSASRRGCSACWMRSR